MYEGIRDKIGPFGTYRIDVLKQSFRSIIEDIVPLELKIFMTMHQKSTVEKIVKLGRYKNKFHHKPYKFYKETTEETIEDILFRFEFSNSIINYWEKSAPDFNKFLDELKGYVHDLVKLRNKIFTLLKIIHESAIETNLYKDLTIEDISSMAKVCQYMKGSRFFGTRLLRGL